MTTHTTTLSLKSLHLLPGLSDDFAQRIEAAVLDCKQRPALAKNRTVTLEVSVLPDPEDAENALIQTVVKAKTPARSTLPIKAIRTRGNQLKFDFDDEDLES